MEESSPNSLYTALMGYESALKHIWEAIDKMPEDAATSSRDFGRGYSLAIKDVQETILEQYARVREKIEEYNFV